MAVYKSRDGSISISNVVVDVARPNRTIYWPDTDGTTFVMRPAVAVSK